MQKVHISMNSPRLALLFWGRGGYRQFLRSVVVVNLMVVPAFVGAFTLMFADFDKLFSGFLLSLVIAESCSTAALIGSLLAQFLYRLVTHKGIEEEFHWGRFRWELVGISLALILGVWCGYSLLLSVAKTLGWQIGELGFDNFRSWYFAALSSFAVTNILVGWQRTRQEKEIVELEKIKLENAHLKAKFSALTAQMDPHFLFNSLNSIAELIHSNPMLAEQAIESLSQLYRDVLLAVKNETHGIQDEIKICVAYLKMEKIRFGNRLFFAMEGLKSLPENSPEIPVMILQPLVENAVKHGALRNLEGGSITIAVNAFDDRIELSVQDNGKSELIQPKGIAGAGTAIANCRTRLDLLYRGKASISHQSIAGQGTKVVVSIPFFNRGAQ